MRNLKRSLQVLTWGLFSMVFFPNFAFADCEIDLGPDIHLCNKNEVFVLDVGNEWTSIFWLYEGIDTISTNQFLTIGGGWGGVFCVVVQDSFGCVATDCIEVTTSNLWLVTSGDVITCDSTDVQVSATAEFSSGEVYFDWSTGATTPDIIVPFGASGTYYVLVTDDFGCVAMDSVEVIFIECPPEPDCEEGEDLLENGDFELGNVGFESGLSESCECLAFSYCIAENARDKCSNTLWKHIKGVNEEGKYMVVDGQNNTLIWSSEVLVEEGVFYEFSFFLFPSISGAVSPTLAVRMNDIPVLTDVKGQILDEWNQVTTVWEADFTGLVTVSIEEMAAIGFDDYGLDQIKFAQCESSSLQEKNVVSPSFSLAPNPASELLMINSFEPSTNPSAWRILDMHGRFLAQGIKPTNLSNFNVDVSTLPSGGYVFQLITANQVFSERFLKH